MEKTSPTYILKLRQNIIPLNQHQIPTVQIWLQSTYHNTLSRTRSQQQYQIVDTQPNQCGNAKPLKPSLQKQTKKLLKSSLVCSVPCLVTFKVLSLLVLGEMEMESVCSNAVVSEGFLCSVMEAVLLQTAKSLAFLLLMVYTLCFPGFFFFLCEFCVLCVASFLFYSLVLSLLCNIGAF